VIRVNASVTAFFVQYFLLFFCLLNVISLAISRLTSSLLMLCRAVVKSLDPTELSLSGLESFALDYTVRWPLSLVISRKALTKYQVHASVCCCSDD